MKELRDVFLCHAREDKELIVRPLMNAFQGAAITCWVDDIDIKWGDSFIKVIGEGLTKSRYVIPVISEFFIGKPWPEYELDAAQGMEASGGEIKVLPLIVGDQVKLLAHVKQNYPFLRNRKFLFWNGDPQLVVNALQSRLGKSIDNANADSVSSETDPVKGATYIPKLSKDFTQRDKDHFLETSFDSIREYFRRATGELQARYREVDADFIEVDDERFRSRIYLRGELKNECLIRIGGLISRDSIGYTEGTRTINENSYNEIISIADNDSELFLRFSMGTFPYSDRSMNYDPLETAEALWRRFVSPLERR